MKLLLTGATGYIGKKLVAKLKELNHDLYVVARPESDVSGIDNCVESIIFNTDLKKMHGQICQIRPEGWINLAGTYYGVHDVDKIAPLLNDNIVFETYVLDAVVKSGGSVVIHTSSFQQRKDGKEYSPINLYASVKQAFEDILFYYSSTEKIREITLELFDTYGSDDNRNKVFNYVRRLKAGDTLDMSPGEQKMYFCYIDDDISAYIKALEILMDKNAGFRKKYSVRGENPIELKSFVDQYIKLVGSRISVNWGKRPYMEQEIMDPTGYGIVLPGWKSEIGYEQGIQLCVEYDLLREKNDEK